MVGKPRELISGYGLLSGKLMRATLRGCGHLWGGGQVVDSSGESITREERITGGAYCCESSGLNLWEANIQIIIIIALETSQSKCEVLLRVGAYVYRCAPKTPRVTRTGTYGPGRAPKVGAFGYT